MAMEHNEAAADRQPKTILEWIRDITEGLGTESSKKTDSYALVHVMARELSLGRARWVDDFSVDVVVPVREFEHYGRSNFTQDCAVCREKINLGEPVWFRRKHAGARSLAFHEECFNTLRSGAGSPRFPLFAALQADGLVK